jgi:hypothetical protein
MKMGVPAKERFSHRPQDLFLGRFNNFPPEYVTYQDVRMCLLGESNKKDLIPASIEDVEILKAITNQGEMGQYIYSDVTTGNLYDACMYRNANDEAYVYSIRTRELPKPEPKKKKEEVQVSAE